MYFHAGSYDQMAKKCDGPPEKSSDTVFEKIKCTPDGKNCKNGVLFRI